MYIGWDLQIYSTEDDRPARARASGFVEELGQVRLAASLSMQNWVTYVKFQMFLLLSRDLKTSNVKPIKQVWKCKLIDAGGISI